MHINARSNVEQSGLGQSDDEKDGHSDSEDGGEDEETAGEEVIVIEDNGDSEFHNALQAGGDNDEVNLDSILSSCCSSPLEVPKVKSRITRQ